MLLILAFPFLLEVPACLPLRQRFRIFQVIEAKRIIAPGFQKNKKKSRNQGLDLAPAFHWRTETGFEAKPGTAVWETAAYSPYFLEFRLFLIAPARPARPVPSKTMLVGSGTPGGAGPSVAKPVGFPFVGAT